MKKSILILFCGSLILASCGDSKKDGDSEGGDKAVSCNEKNTAEVTINGVPAGSEFSHVKAWRGGWNISGGKHRLNVNIAFANHDIEMSSWAGPNVSEDTTMFQIHLSFNGPMSDKEGDYPEVEKGTFEPGSSFSDTPVATLVVFKGNRGMMAYSSADQIQGTAEITNLTEDHVCGHAYFIDNGSEVKLSFSAPIEKDLFEDVRK